VFCLFFILFLHSVNRSVKGIPHPWQILSLVTILYGYGTFQVVSELLLFVLVRDWVAVCEFWLKIFGGVVKFFFWRIKWRTAWRLQEQKKTISFDLFWCSFRVVWVLVGWIQKVCTSFGEKWVRKVTFQYCTGQKSDFSNFTSSLNCSLCLSTWLYELVCASSAVCELKNVLVHHCASWSTLVNCASWSTVRVWPVCEVKCAGSSVRVECAGEVCEVAKIVSVRGGPVLSVRAH